MEISLTLKPLGPLEYKRRSSTRSQVHCHLQEAQLKCSDDRKWRTSTCWEVEQSTVQFIPRARTSVTAELFCFKLFFLEAYEISTLSVWSRTLTTNLAISKQNHESDPSICPPPIPAKNFPKIQIYDGFPSQHSTGRFSYCVVSVNSVVGS